MTKNNITVRNDAAEFLPREDAPIWNLRPIRGS